MPEIRPETEASSHGSNDAIEPETKKCKQDTEFYTVSEDYWKSQPATVNGMLGGYECVSDADINQSQKFLSTFLDMKKIDNKLAIDCGAGIGRITKNLLLNNFDTVEMCDVSSNFIDAATKYLGPENAARVPKFHCCGLQNFYPEADKYDCIWIQWVVGYLKDDDLISFLKRCKQAIKSNGVCILKENISSTEYELDETDNSWTRTKKCYMNLIHKAGMRVIKDEKQRKFPGELYEVRLFAFK